MYNWCEEQLFTYYLPQEHTSFCYMQFAFVYTRAIVSFTIKGAGGKKACREWMRNYQIGTLIHTACPMLRVKCFDLIGDATMLIYWQHRVIYGGTNTSVIWTVSRLPIVPKQKPASIFPLRCFYWNSKT